MFARPYFQLPELNAFNILPFPFHNAVAGIRCCRHHADHLLQHHLYQCRCHCGRRRLVGGTHQGAPSSGPDRLGREAMDPWLRSQNQGTDKQEFVFCGYPKSFVNSIIKRSNLGANFYVHLVSVRSPVVSGAPQQPIPDPAQQQPVHGSRQQPPQWCPHLGHHLRQPPTRPYSC